MSTSQTSGFDKISPTALLTAYARQYSDIPYTKEIAELANAQETLNQFLTSKEQQEPTVLGLAALVEARYKAIEQVRAKFNGRQILELASGLLPRGMVLSENPAIAFIESDLPGIIQKKQQLVRQLIGERSNLHFLALMAKSCLGTTLLTCSFFPLRLLL